MFWIQLFLLILGDYKCFIKDLDKIYLSSTALRKECKYIEYATEFDQTAKLPYITISRLNKIFYTNNKRYLSSYLPIWYSGRTLNPAEINYNIIEKIPRDNVGGKSL